MKKVLLSVAVVAAFASCGGPSICDCMTEEQQKSDACVKMKEDMEAKVKDMSEEEKAEEMKKVMEEAAKCESKDEEKKEEH